MVLYGLVGFFLQRTEAIVRTHSLPYDPDRQVFVRPALLTPKFVSVNITLDAVS